MRKRSVEEKCESVKRRIKGREGMTLENNPENDPEENGSGTMNNRWAATTRTKHATTPPLLTMDSSTLNHRWEMSAKRSSWLPCYDECAQQGEPGRVGPTITIDNEIETVGRESRK